MGMFSSLLVARENWWFEVKLYCCECLIVEIEISFYQVSSSHLKAKATAIEAPFVHG